MTVRLSFNDLVNEAVNLEFQDYERFVNTVNQLRSQKPGTKNLEKESALLEKINNGFPIEKWTRMQELDDRMEHLGLSDKDLKELAGLTEAYEKFTVQRIVWIKKIALLRKAPIDKVMLELGFSNGKA